MYACDREILDNCLVPWGLMAEIIDIDASKAAKNRALFPNLNEAHVNLCRIDAFPNHAVGE